MAGTNSTKPHAATVSEGGGPAIILVDPQLGENIGTSARAMLNCGLTDLRLVRPREEWPNPKAAAAASGAGVVLERARVYHTTAEAVADLRHVFAATGRGRDMNKRIVTPRRCGEDLRRFGNAGDTCGVLFGPERSGLVNDDLALADTVVTASLNPAFRSLNLAQAVLLVCYEWFQAGRAEPEERLVKGGAKPATKREILHFFEHLERELDASGFLRISGKRPIMVRNLRNMFQRAGLMDHEVRTLRGVITSLVGGRERGRKAGD